MEVTAEEAKKLAANALVVDETTCIIDSQHQSVIKELRKQGHNVIEMPYGAVATWGRAFRCSHYPLIRQNTLKVNLGRGNQHQSHSKQGSFPF
jgi:N-dimethylarginine dimethylaminohydrolase